jgi:hypothetical protein
MAMKGTKSLAWKEVEQREVENMLKHEVWIKRLKRDGDAPIASTWVYWRKLGPESQVIKCKA